jgi:hypothetical protein
MATVLAPPPQYDHAYPGPIIEQILPLEEARKLCQAIGVGPFDGCAAFITLNDGSRACFIVVPSDDAPDPVIADYEKHEIGHCNGWSPNHDPE